MSKLFLIRHGKSEWNKLGKWTGWTDVLLAPEGYQEAEKAGIFLRDEDVHIAYTSDLKRTWQTLEKIKEISGKLDLGFSSHKALTERNYGIHTGKNKWQVKEEMGEEAFLGIRRGWDVPIIDGETLKEVHARVVPFYEENIKRDLMNGENVLVVSHGNTLRALIKHLENLDEVQVCNLEVETGDVHCYLFDNKGNISGKEIRSSR